MKFITLQFTIAGKAKSVNSKAEFWMQEMGRAIGKTGSDGNVLVEISRHDELERTIHKPTV